MTTTLTSPMPEAAAPNLAGLSRSGLQRLFTGLGEKPFRAAQVMKWIHQHGVMDIDAMTDISKPLRETLKRQTRLDGIGTGFGADGDAGTDADSGVDTGAGADSGVDAGTGADSGADAGAGTDSGVDAGAGADSGVDASTGADSGVDGFGGIALPGISPGSTKRSGSPERLLSADGSRKWIIRLADGNRVETVFIPEAGRGTLCISSQAGCALDCSFCATGKQGFAANLSAAEIVGQLWWATHELGGFKSQRTASRSTAGNSASRSAAGNAASRSTAGNSASRSAVGNPASRSSTRKTAGNAADHRPISNVVMMGMGEPLLNFEPVMEAIDIMLDDCAYGLSKRRVTISTAGVVPAIRRMIGRTQASLAVSLHAPDDELRSQLMPVNRRYPIHELLDAVADYMASLPDRRVPVMEYTLIKGVNDHRQHARDLAQLLRHYPCKINLIPFNPFPESDYEPPSAATVSRFRDILQQAGFTVTVRTTRAADIAAACGQLVGQVKDRTRRRERLVGQRLIAADSNIPPNLSATQEPAATTV